MLTYSFLLPMLKYRLLTNDELKELEEEFKYFLIANNIYDQEWKLLNKHNVKKANELVILFSNLVFEKALKKITFLEIITSNGINAFKCNEDKMELVGIGSNKKNFNFKSLKTTSNFNQLNLSIFKTSKPYYKQREIEVFDLLNSGCSIISEERYKKLELAYNFSRKPIKN